MTTIAPPSDSDVQASVDRVALELFSRLERKQKHPSRRKRALLGIGGLSLAAVLVGGGGAVAGVWHLPGAATDRIASQWKTVGGVGSTVIDLGTAPSDATWIALRFSCLSAGAPEFDIGGDESVGINCTGADAPQSSNGSDTFALGSRDVTLTVTADPGTRWSTDYRFIDRQWTPWGTNAKGDTYGVARDTDGIVPSSPDLMAVGDDNGVIAYVYTKDFNAVPPGLPEHPTQAQSDAWNAEHAHDVRSIPAYKSDGVTVVGQFVLGGDDGGLKLDK